MFGIGNTPAVSYRYVLRVEGVFDVACRKVRGFQKNNEYEYIQEGGLNDFVHMRRKPISQPFTFQVERYVDLDIIDPLPLGTDLTLPIMLFVGGHKGSIQLAPKRTYIFTGCTVIGKEYGELNAEQSGLTVDTITIAYREMYMM